MGAQRRGRCRQDRNSTEDGRFIAGPVAIARWAGGRDWEVVESVVRLAGDDVLDDDRGVDPLDARQSAKPLLVELLISDEILGHHPDQAVWFSEQA
ncbi:MAG TPA: hypothetical protein VLA55_02295 [Ornithinibacter sp.]|nr:hypothetical protein [Ornithinibacter sp.]